jgi:hypothetical protein
LKLHFIEKTSENTFGRAQCIWQRFKLFCSENCRVICRQLRLILEQTAEDGLSEERRESTCTPNPFISRRWSHEGRFFVTSSTLLRNNKTPLCLHQEFGYTGLSSQVFFLCRRNELIYGNLTKKSGLSNPKSLQVSRMLRQKFCLSSGCSL